MPIHLVKPLNQPQLQLQPRLGSLDNLILQATLDLSKNSCRAYTRALKQYSEFSGGVLNRQLIQNYLAGLLNRGLSSASINQQLAAIKKLAEISLLASYINTADATAIANLHSKKQRGIRMGRWMSKTELESLLSSIGNADWFAKRDRAMVGLLAGCGLRRSEISALTWDQIREVEGRWLIVDLPGKGGKIRSIPVSGWVRMLLEELETAEMEILGRYNDLEPRFKGLGEGKHPVITGIDSRTPISANGVYFAVGRRMQNAGLKFAPHDLRRTFAKLARTGGAKIEQIQLVLGHSSLKTTERYLNSELEIANGKSATDALSVSIKLGG